MVPSAYVVLEQLPLTPNGKVDRQALPAPSSPSSESTPGLVAPRTPEEKALATIWAEVLGVQSIGIHDNFFALGGHSLLAVRVMHTVEQTLGQRATVAQLFATPTIAQIAARFSLSAAPAAENTITRLCQLWEAEFATGPLNADSNFFALGGDWMRAMSLVQQVAQEFQTEFSIADLIAGPTIGQMARHLGQQISPASPFLLPFHPTGTRRPFFCVWMPYQLAATLGPEQPVYGLYPHGLDGQTIPQTIEEIAADYVQAIRSVQPQGPYVLGGYCFGSMVALEMAHQLRQQGEQVATLFLFDPAIQHVRQQSRATGSLAPAPLFTSTGSPVTPSALPALTAQHPVRVDPVGLWKGSSRRVGKLLQALRRTTTKMRCQLYLKAGYQLPLSLREFYVDQTCFSLLRRYRPQPYAERTVVFAVAEYFTTPRPLDWLLPGEVGYYYLPGSHQEVFTKTYLPLWTPRLANILHQVTSPSLPDA
jgi:aryl carrier-like protein/pimeloyl-ACP methyl ester carboxylesterase